MKRELLIEKSLITIHRKLDLLIDYLVAKALLAKAKKYRRKAIHDKAGEF